MEEKEKNNTSEELNTNNLFALASQEIEEEKRKESLENNEIKDDSDKTSLEDLFKIEKLSKDNENFDSNSSQILNDNQDIEQEESIISELNTESSSFFNVTKDDENIEQEESIISELNTESSPFFNVTKEDKDIEQEESTISEPNTEPNPFLNVTKDDKDIEQEESTISEPNTETSPFLNVTKEDKDIEQEESTISEPNTETSPFSNVTKEDKDIEQEESTISEPNTEPNPFFNVTKDHEDIEQEESTISEPNTESSPFFAVPNDSDATNDTTNIANPFFRENNIQLNEKDTHTNNQKIDLSNVPHYDVKIQKKKPKKMKMILGVLSYAIFIWLLLIGVALLIYVGNVKIKEMKGDYTPPKYNAYVVLTGSMLPKIKVEDVVVTKKVDAKDLKEGDIITFASSDERYAGTIITHRIKKKYYDSTTGKYTFQSKGDNNNVADNALVEEENIYGKVILKIPKLGYLQLFLASKGGWILVILIPCAVVVSFDIVKLFKMMAQKRKFKIVK